MKITIIGAGNMGGALAWGLARSGAVPASDLTVTARHEEKLEKFKALGLQTATDNVEAVRGSDLVFYAVKPWQMEAVVRETAPVLDYGRQTAVSVAPGIRPEDLKAWFTRDGALPQLAYAIPNTAVEVGEGATYLASVTASDETVSQLVRLFDRVGKSFVVPLDRMLAGTSLASCGIAYAMRYMGAAAEGGARLGLDPRQASEAVCQTVRGAAALVGAKDYDTEGEISRVTTPNGLTARGLAAMEAAGFSDAVIRWAATCSPAWTAHWIPPASLPSWTRLPSCGKKASRWYWFPAVPWPAADRSSAVMKNSPTCSSGSCIPPSDRCA